MRPLGDSLHSSGQCFEFPSVLSQYRFEDDGECTMRRKCTVEALWRSSSSTVPVDRQLAVRELGSEQASVPYFRRKEHCSRGLKRGAAWAWLLLMRKILQTGRKDTLIVPRRWQIFVVNFSDLYA